MNPPAGRIQIDDRVTVRDGRSGVVVGERLVASNGSWRYDVALDDGSRVDALDYDLRKVTAA